SLAAAFSLAQEMDKDQIIVVQETEYTGAGKHIQPQLSFARQNGIEIKFGNPEEEVPGKNIILPAEPSLLKAKDVDLDKLKVSLIKNYIKDIKDLTDNDINFLIAETKSNKEYINSILETIGR
ncbi:MAG: PLP-dependent lyase/thiolase, partial [Fusobacterium periodonticum]|nr:PLP-dependent lyase/thiolase [Fusobacterium periodonticum]